MEVVNKISVVTPVLNQSRFIDRTIRSVLEQQVSVPVEYLVMDGGSTDGTLDILKGYGDRIRVTSGRDRGMADALNKGFDAASGDVIGWLNADDCYLPGTLQKVAGYFNTHPRVLWLYGHCNMIGSDDRETRRWITAYKVKKSVPFNYNRLLVENYISQPSVFFRRRALDLAGNLDITLPTAMDYDFWLRLARVGEPGVIDSFLSSFRVHGESISARNIRSQFREQYMIHLRYDQRPWPLFRHRVMNGMIVAIYSLMALPRKLSTLTGQGGK